MAQDASLVVLATNSAAVGPSATPEGATTMVTSPLDSAEAVAPVTPVSVAPAVPPVVVVPLEEMLGSVTTYNNSGDGIETKSTQLRQSARVFKKMRLDSAAMASTSNSANNTALDGITKSAKDSASAAAADKKDGVDSKSKQHLRPLWLSEHTDLLFEALNEYGKDFDALHGHISAKLRKKGVPEAMIKTREQIRHLYQRIWHKISKHLKFSSEVKKVSQELYGMINYGELRKKLVSVSPKTTVKLNELIYRGTMALRIKGKVIRIKTPICRALRRLNRLDEKLDDIKLPTRVTIELKPRDMSTWYRLQEMSQNPRVKTVVPLQKRLSSLLRNMGERWQSQQLIDFQRTVSLAKECGLELNTTELEEKRQMLAPTLRLCPPAGHTVHVPSINFSEFFTSDSICLNAYEKRMGVSVPGEELWLNSNFKLSCKSASKKLNKRQRIEASANVSISSPTKANSSGISYAINNNNKSCSSSAPVIDSSSGSESASDKTITDPAIVDCVDEAVNTILALQSSIAANSTVDSADSSEEAIIATVSSEIKEEVDSKDNLELKKRLEDVDKIKLGWTLEEAGTLSVGDLYLMFGSDSKLELEYSWDPVKARPTTTDDTAAAKTESELTETDDKHEFASKSSISCNPNSLSNTLQRLLSMAKLHYRRNIIRCPCGHVCDDTKPEKANKLGAAVVSNLNIVLPRSRNLKQQLRVGNASQQVATSSVDDLPEDDAERDSTRPIPIAPKPTTAFGSPFVRPASPNICLRAQLDSIQRLKPRYCNRRGRPRTTQVIVERRLPLLANKGNNEETGQIVQMNIISQDGTLSTSSSSMPRAIAPKPTTSTSGSRQLPTLIGISPITTMQVDMANITTIPVAIVSSSSMDMGISSTANTICLKVDHNDDNAMTPSRACSPISISNLLDLQGLNGSNPGSPCRMVGENQQWLNSEISDFSLTSFLGHLDTAMKGVTSAPSSINGDDTRLLAHDVDAQLQSLLTETSLDYTAQFADLAAQVADTKK